MGPENFQPEKRLPKSTRRQIRNLKNEVRQELVNRQISPQEEWAAMEKLLTLRLPHYPQLAANGLGIIQDWYETLKGARFLDAQAKREVNRSFLARHDLEQIKAVRDALAVITQVLNK